jgi:hypothetical protein
MIILYYKSDGLLKITDPIESIDRLYYLDATVPKVRQVAEYIKIHESTEIAKYFEKYGIKGGIRRIRSDLSMQYEKIPLYDIYGENLYIVSKFNVYNRVIHQHYRFPTQNFYDRLKAEREGRRTDAKSPDILERRKYRKLQLMVSFLSSFDLDLLYKSYIMVFYLYANEVGKNITTCKRPSFLPHFMHIKPYYSRSEIINLALNMGIGLENRYYEIEDINSLCDPISSNDISASTLLKHQRYIIERNKVGLVQYYTLQGSFFINQYLRNMTSYEYRNMFLESIITPMWELLNGAPPFDKSYTLYRFVSNDSYLRNLNIGDMYTEEGFMSTTRDPFYRSDLYKFGFILIKVNVPEGVKGVALCIETISHFPEEQEIILPPLSIFRLDSKDDKIKYYHTDEKFASQIKTRYEFTYIGKRSIRYIDRPIYSRESYVDFLKISNEDAVALEDRIKYFVSKYVNPLFQFDCVIGDSRYTVAAERYDSTGAYSKFYAVPNQNGFSMYTIHNDYILFMIEMGEDASQNRKYMHVNYYVKYSVLDRGGIISDDNFIKFISSVAYYFAIDRVIVWADYKGCGIDNLTGGAQIQRKFSGELQTISDKAYYPKLPDKFKMDTSIKYPAKYLGGSYCTDFYQYLKNNKKKYSGSGILNVELQPKFLYHQLDKLRTVDYNLILKKEDQDEIFQIYEKVYKLEGSRDHNIADFYVWMSENKCYLMDTFVLKMGRFYRVDNPFAYDYYVLDPITFLYNRRYIQTFPAFVTDASTVTLKDSKNIMPKNEYRLRPRSINQNF